jgi:molybdenum cofactor sulfurtransferase
MPSRVAGERVDEVRARTLDFFGADPNEYDLIFVANATAAIKLVCDAFRDYSKTTKPLKKTKLSKRSQKSGKWNVFFHKDAHTSLVGMREHSTHQRCFGSDDEVDAWIDHLSSPLSKDDTPTLFAYPGQSNMTGRRLPLTWCQRIRASRGTSGIYTLLDAAALATTKRLKISEWQPDFVAVSFYKIFGFPDLGALLVRKDTSGPILDSRRYFGGGTVDIVIALDAQWHMKKEEAIHERHEDGTLPFHNIIALGHALDALPRIYGSMDAISAHTAALTRNMHSELTSLIHQNGTPVIRIYNDTCATYGNPATQGATVAFSILTPAGAILPFKAIEREADAHNVYLRTGGLCNPGGVATYLGWTKSKFDVAYALGHTCTKPLEVYGGRATGVVRASLGACSSQEDVDMLIAFLKREYVDITDEAVMGMSTCPIRPIDHEQRLARIQNAEAKVTACPTRSPSKRAVRRRLWHSSYSKGTSIVFVAHHDLEPDHGTVEFAETDSIESKPSGKERIGGILALPVKWAKSVIDLSRRQAARAA